MLLIDKPEPNDYLPPRSKRLDGLCLFYRYFNDDYSQEIANLVPPHEIISSLKDPTFSRWRSKFKERITTNSVIYANVDPLEFPIPFP